jgi:hypothetical protein
MTTIRDDEIRTIATEERLAYEADADAEDADADADDADADDTDADADDADDADAA